MIIKKKKSAFLISRNTCKKHAEHQLRTSALGLCEIMGAKINERKFLKIKIACVWSDLYQILQFLFRSLCTICVKISYPESEGDLNILTNLDELQVTMATPKICPKLP